MLEAQTLRLLHQQWLVALQDRLRVVPAYRGNGVDVCGVDLTVLEGLGHDREVVQVPAAAHHPPCRRLREAA